MVSVNTRELTHNFSNYLKKVQAGERIVVMNRDHPVAVLSSVEENVLPPWKQVLPRVSLRKKGMTAAGMVVKCRDEERF